MELVDTPRIVCKAARKSLKYAVLTQSLRHERYLVYAGTN